jgi:hypothetical protein
MSTTAITTIKMKLPYLLFDDPSFNLIIYQLKTKVHLDFILFKQGNLSIFFEQEGKR